MEATGAPEQRREPVKTEDAVASFMRDIAARNWQEPTQRKFRTLLVDRLQFYAASKGYRYLNQMTLDVITEFRATDALLKLGILDGVMLCRPRQARLGDSLRNAFFAGSSLCCVQWFLR